MKTYKVLQQSHWENARFALVPIRSEDRLAIMQWRNEQIYHLRQAKPLTVEDQEQYFKNVVAQLFDQEQPNQILFSFLENGNCIGYGGLVHINWIDKNAEISFIMNTALEKERFHELWSAYLDLLEKVAFEDLKLHKIYTYAFDLRPHLYTMLQRNNYTEEARLKEHCFFDGTFLDVVFHVKLNTNTILRKANKNDLEVTYTWANNPDIRRYSVTKESIPFENHSKWFLHKINADSCYYLIAEMNQQPVGSIRFDIDEHQTAVISYLVDPKFQGKGLGRFLLFEGVKILLKEKPLAKISGMVFKENTASMKAFTQLGYHKIDQGDSFVYFEKIIK
ncbi:GNAT family N-acetyltransferase [Flavobacterium sp.]|uniref:GNAT family N-acetyltransferase n=1 Tax=Flavobacterium sp. TaxID=239 RepID=UPI002FDCF418